MVGSKGGVEKRCKLGCKNSAVTGSDASPPSPLVANHHPLLSFISHLLPRQQAVSFIKGSLTRSDYDLWVYMQEASTHLLSWQGSIGVGT